MRSLIKTLLAAPATVASLVELSNKHYAQSIIGFTVVFAVYILLSLMVDLATRGVIGDS